MTGMVKIDFKMPDMLGKLMAAKGELDLFIAANMQTNRGMMFDKEGAYNGHRKWAKLKTRQGQILSKTGTLRKSMMPNGGGIVRFEGKKITIGTNIAYAAMMNWGTTGLPGGVLKPKDPNGVLRFKVGNKVVFAKSVKIPARRFDTWNSADKFELQYALTMKIAEILNR